MRRNSLIAQGPKKLVNQTLENLSRNPTLFLVHRETWLLSALPCLYFLYISSQVRSLLPLFAGVDTFDYDAAYTYLVSSISLTLGDVPSYADHPGTLNHILLALSLRIAQVLAPYNVALVRQCASTTCLALDYPEQVLGIAGVIGLLFFVSSIFFLGWSFYWSRSSSLVTAILSQSVFLSFPTILPFAKIINGETVGLPCLLYACSLIILSNSIQQQPAERNNVSSKFYLLGAALSGFYMSFVLLSKLSFLPAALLLAMHKRTNAFLLSLLTLIAGFYFWGQNYSNWNSFKRYWLSITTHSGHYGGGSSGLFDWSQMLKNLILASNTFPFLILMVSILLIVASLSFVATRSARLRLQAATTVFLYSLSTSLVLYGIVYATSGFRAFLYSFVGMLVACLSLFSRNDVVENHKNKLHELLVLFISLSISILAVLKHYDVRYLAVPVGISCIGAGFMLESMRMLTSESLLKRGFSRVLRISIATILSIVFILQFLTLSRSLGARIFERNTVMGHDNKVLHRINLEHPGAQWIGEYRIKGIKDFALAFGFLMAASDENLNHHIMSRYSNPDKKYWIWSSSRSQLWNQVDGWLSLPEFLAKYQKRSYKFIFALPDSVAKPSLPIRKIANLDQGASIYIVDSF